MSTGREEEQLIERYKKEFTDKTGKNIKICYCSKWESTANFTDKIEFWKLFKAVQDYTGWKKEDTFVENRKEEKVLRRGIIDYIAVNNQCTLVDCGKFTKRDHSTVINSIRKFEDKLDTDMYVRALFSEIIIFLRENYHLYKSRVITENEVE